MDREQIKSYVQKYLENVIIPNIEDEDQILDVSVHEILKGSYQPPIIHVFIDTTPNLKPREASNNKKIKKIEREIENFFKYLSIPYKIKVHFNERPVGFDNQNYDFSL